MKKYLIPTIKDAKVFEYNAPLCVGVSDTEHPTDPILAPMHPHAEEEAPITGPDFWKSDNEEF